MFRTSIQSFHVVEFAVSSPDLNKDDCIAAAEFFVAQVCLPRLKRNDSFKAAFKLRLLRKFNDWRSVSHLIVADIPRRSRNPINAGVF